MATESPIAQHLPALVQANVSRRAFTVGAAALAGTGALSYALANPAVNAFAQEATTATSDELTLAVVDFQPIWGDVDSNVAAMGDYVAQAAEQGVGLILFPEMCVTGYVYSEDETDEDSRMCIEAAQGTDGSVATTMSQLAVDNGMWIVYGGTEPVDGDDAHAYNSAFACSPDGTVQTYRKIHPVEGAWCTPGEEPLILETAWGNVAVDICYDTYATPELERTYAAKGCRLLLNPTATSRGFDSDAGDATLWQWYFDSRIKNIAMRDQIFVASANLAGYDGSHFTFPGGSCAWGPTGSDGTTSFAERVVGEASAGKVEGQMFVGTLDLSLATATDILNSENFKPELYAGWYGELASTGEDALVAAPDETTAIVSAVNFTPTFGDKEANCTAMAGYIEEAAQAGTNILVFPEMALTGYA